MTTKTFWAEIPKDAKQLLKGLVPDTFELESSSPVYLFIGRYGAQVKPLRGSYRMSVGIESPILIPDDFVYAYITLRRIHKDLATVYEIFTDMVNQ